MQKKLTARLAYRNFIKTIPRDSNTSVLKLLLRREFQLLRYDNYVDKHFLEKQSSFLWLQQYIKEADIIDTNSELIILINQALKNVLTVINIINSQQKLLQRYFKQAKTTIKYVRQSYLDILKYLMEIKAETIQKRVNLYLVSVAITGIKGLFTYKNIIQMGASDQALFILDIQFKLHCCFDLIMRSLNIEHDITTVDKQKNSQFWKRVKFSNVGNKQKIQRKLYYFNKLLTITTSAVINSRQFQGQYLKWAVFGLSYPYYITSHKRSFFRARSFYKNPTVDLAQAIWNLPEHRVLKHGVELTMPRIKSNLRIYIPLAEDSVPHDITQYNKDSIEVRVLYDKKLEVKCLQDAFVKKSESSKHKIQEIIIYMHGGGFLALSSQTQQVITRRWAIELNVPIFSIDYRVPPEYPFPAAPNDCLKVYKFIVDHIHQYFEIHPKKIILSGDSAGGNLAFSLTGLILKYNLHIPHGIYAAYPAADVRKYFSPSKIFAFTDPLLYPSMLLLCLKEYIGDSQQNQNNPIACPILLTQEFIGGQKGDFKIPKKWPKTILHVGAKDPLYDDSVRFAHRLFQRGIQYEMHVYDDLSHGFLNLDFFIPECKKTISDSIKHLQKLLQ